MTDDLRIAPIAPIEMDALLPLIAAYQRFYEVVDEEIDDERNRAFFARFLVPRRCCSTTSTSPSAGAAKAWAAP